MADWRRIQRETGETNKPGPDMPDSGFDSSPARLSENRRRGMDEALPLIPMSALMTKTHFLMCPTCPNDVLPAGLVCTVVKGPNNPQQGLSLHSRPPALSTENSSHTSLRQSPALDFTSLPDF